jgi:signal transduction histidine kinase
MQSITWECLSLILPPKPKIISDLLDFGRVKSVDRKRTQASSLISQVLEKYPPPENVIVSSEIETDLPLVTIDPIQIGQVLENLITNSYQAMSEGGKLTSEAKVTEDFLSLVVADNDPGINLENMEKIFEPLFTTKHGGIGLGLALSKNLAEINGGSLNVKSIEGEGSTFSLLLPVMVDPNNG